MVHRSFNHKSSQSTVSDILSDRYKHLDGVEEGVDRKRQRRAQWPILEAILADWQRRCYTNGAGTSYEVLKQKAEEIWPQIPDYNGQPVPEFSIGWFTKFKKRHGIKYRQRHGEATSVPEQAEDEMKAVRTICGEYPEDYVYNMDETGLLWRNAVNRDLFTANAPGRKMNKTRITLVVTTNATGSDRLPLWFIGKAKVPHALKGLNFTALGCFWRWNKKAWMNSGIMVEWLQEFYKHIGTDRSVILTIDNLKAHIKGVVRYNPLVPQGVARSSTKYDDLQLLSQKHDL